MEDMDSQSGFAKGGAEGTEKELKAMKTVTLNLIDGLSTHLSSGEVNQHDAGSMTVKIQSADRNNPRQGSDAETPQGHFSPIFSSDRFTPEQTHTEEPPDGLPNRRGIAVVVPPLERRWEYRVYKEKTTIDKVLKHIKKLGQLQYLVKFIDAQELMITSEHLSQLPGGLKSIQVFNNQLLSQLQQSGSSDSDNIMVSTRSLQSKRRRPAGFVDITQLDLSGDDQLSQPTATTFRTSRTSRKRRLLSMPKPVHNGRVTRSRVPPSESPISTQQSESESSGSSFDRSKRRSLRLKPPKALERTKHNKSTPENESDDPIESDESQGYQQGYLGKRKRGPFQELETRATRRSDRTGRKLGGMRERGEDDIPDTTLANTIVKAVGAKESFKVLPENDEFLSRHQPFCDTCGDGGDSAVKGRLVYCQGCTLSYHQSCLGPRGTRDHLVTKVGHQDFVLQCRRCVETIRKKDDKAPRQGRCQECHEIGSSCAPFRERKTPREEQKEREDNDGEDPVVDVSLDRVNNASNILFRCVSCYRGFHLHHLPLRSDKGILEGGNDEHYAMERFIEYSRDWSCKECISAPTKLETLIAWRPIDVDKYTLGESTEQINEDDKEYLVKWANLSYYRATWLPGAWVWGVSNATMRKAFARRDNGTNLPKMRFEDAVPEDYLRVDIVFEVKYTNVVSTRLLEVDKARIKEIDQARVKYKGLGYEDVVWEDPPDPEDSDRWADFKLAYEDWVLAHYTHLPGQHNLNLHLQKIRSQKFDSKIEMKSQPESLIGGNLMKYQMEGMNWLLYQWHSQQNAILADEMGLGKTIQVIAFLTNLVRSHRCWPFLIVVPDSTCANWRREIKQWAPSLRVVMYFGSARARELAHKYEMYPEGLKDLRCHVLVTSYNTAQDDASQKIFRRIPWQGLIVDEGQRLKNDASLLYLALSKLKVPFKVLLTGTPLQNNQRELFNLLQFLDPSIDAAALEERYAELTKENVRELHDLLRPFFLRRTKVQVLTFLPPVAQMIVPVTVSPLQKELYKSILAKNSDLLRAIFGGDKRGAKVSGLRNLLMQLRKCLCHPFVYNIEIEEKSTNAAVSHQGLVEASSKLQLLDIMLPKLKERGHRVLIFSQFLNMLTITEDFLDGLGMLHQRIDGSMGSLEKQKRIDEFNAPDSPLFACLLSTRAGGVGINLASADTVIILDPDFNPHQDIQALSRAHRIGQKKKVLVFQLMTRGTAEEKIMQIGKKKMAMDHALIEQMDNTEVDEGDLESVLRFGAEALFKDDDTNDIRYDSSSVDKLLDRSQAETTKTDRKESAESQFSFARVWANDKETLEDGLEITSGNGPTVPDSTVWTKILEERSRQVELENAARIETLGRGKRQRQTVNYQAPGMKADELDSPAKRRGVGDSDNDTDFQARDAESEGEETAAEDGEHVNTTELEAPQLGPSRRQDVLKESPLQARSGSFRRANIPMSTMMPPTSYYPPCLACNNSHGSHPPGYCPLKLAGNEHCNLCGLAHFGIPGICPNLSNELACRTMMRQLKDSPETPAVKKASAQHLRGIISGLVQKDREKILQQGRPQGRGTALGVPGSYVSPYIPPAAGNDPLMRVPYVFEPSLGNNAFGYSGSLQGLVPPVPPASQSPTIPQPRMPITTSHPPRSNLPPTIGQPRMPSTVSYHRPADTKTQSNGK